MKKTVVKRNKTKLQSRQVVKQGLRDGAFKIGRIAMLLGAVLATVLIAFVAKVELDDRDRVETEWHSVPVEAPAGKPRVTQESIDLALVIYGIKVPVSAQHPMLDIRLDDRGLSTREPWSEKIRVQIGPSAFDSWGLLGSTLAHELEVHCQQNFFLINVLDSLGLDGTVAAERQAYLHEIRNSARFGLSASNTDLIANTMNYYYNLDKNAAKHGTLSTKIRSSIGQWLARKPVLMTQNR